MKNSVNNFLTRVKKNSPTTLAKVKEPVYTVRGTVAPTEHLLAFLG